MWWQGLAQGGDIACILRAILHRFLREAEAFRHGAGKVFIRRHEHAGGGIFKDVTAFDELLTGEAGVGAEEIGDVLRIDGAFPCHGNANSLFEAGGGRRGFLRLDEAAVKDVGLGVGVSDLAILVGVAFFVFEGLQERGLGIVVEETVVVVASFGECAVFLHRAVIDLVEHQAGVLHLAFVGEWIGFELHKCHGGIAEFGPLAEDSGFALGGGFSFGVHAGHDLPFHGLQSFLGDLVDAPLALHIAVHLVATLGGFGREVVGGGLAHDVLGEAVHELIELRVEGLVLRQHGVFAGTIHGTNEAAGAEDVLRVAGEVFVDVDRGAEVELLRVESMQAVQGVDQGLALLPGGGASALHPGLEWLHEGLVRRNPFGVNGAEPVIDTLGVAAFTLTFAGDGVFADFDALAPGFADEVGVVRLPQDEDIGGDLGAGVFLEGVVGQAHGGHELAVIVQVVPLSTGGLHRVGGGDEGDEAAGFHLGKGTSEEVVMQVEILAELRLGLSWALLGEGHVGDEQVEAVVRNAGVLEAHTGHFAVGRGHGRIHACLGIQAGENAGGDVVEFGGFPLGAVGDVLRLHADEVADTAPWLHGAAAFEAELGDGLPHGVNDRRCGEVGVERAFLGGVEFLFGKLGLEALVGFEVGVRPVEDALVFFGGVVGIEVLPFGKVAAIPAGLGGDVALCPEFEVVVFAGADGVEGFLHPSPAGVSGEDLLFLGRGIAAGGVQLAHELHGGEVGFEFGLVALRGHVARDAVVAVGWVSRLRNQGRSKRQSGWIALRAVRTAVRCSFVSRARNSITDVSTSSSLVARSWLSWESGCTDSLSVISLGKEIAKKAFRALGLLRRCGCAGCAASRFTALRTWLRSG